MQTLLTILAAVISCGIIALHVLSVLFSDKRSTVLNIVNITLHIALVFALLFNGAPLELLALAFMVSLLVYTLAFEIKRRSCGRGEDK